jgi:hypothetical protein
MTRPSIVRPGRFVLLGLLLAVADPASAQAPKPFVAPKDKASWNARREGLKRDVTRSLEAGLPARPVAPKLEIRGRESKPGLTVERFTIDPGTSAAGTIEGVLVLPEGASPSRRWPVVLLVGAPAGSAREVIDGPGLDGRPPAVAMARFGFASLAIDASPGGSTYLRDLRITLDALLARPEFDADRIGVIGLGRAGPVALALMAVDERIDCGVSAIETRDFADLDALYGRGPSPRFESFDAATFVDLLAALCAPRPLVLAYGERLPLPNPSAGRRLEGNIRRLYKLHGPEGNGLASTLFGEFDGHDSVATRLQWMAGLEQLDKHFRPQGPVPLGHDPEPEPELDGTALNLAEHGIAGWAVEMSHRPGCWTWLDGVIACKPGPNEYGWLRAPIEVGDFVLKVEWKVPVKGNAGIFLRARPVAWSIPPGDQSKPRVASLGLDWPSRTGLELQAQDDPGDANRYSSGSLYRHAAPAANPTHPAGQWNRYTVRARGLRVEVWSNGQQVLDTRLDRCTDTLPDPPIRGYIGLQNHGAPAEYRNIRLQKLGD